MPRSFLLVPSVLLVLSVSLAPHATTTLRVKTRGRLAEAALDFAVLNALTAPATHPTLTLVATAE